MEPTRVFVFGQNFTIKSSYRGHSPLLYLRAAVAVVAAAEVGFLEEKIQSALS